MRYQRQLQIEPNDCALTSMNPIEDTGNCNEDCWFKLSQILSNLLDILKATLLDTQHSGYTWVYRKVTG